MCSAEPNRFTKDSVSASRNQALTNALAGECSDVSVRQPWDECAGIPGRLAHVM